jgi:PIN domain nuclease of toxin-antitoxin system
VKLLLDTHILIWALEGRTLLPEASARIANRSSTVYVSAASAWEIAIKRALGKLRAPDDLEEQVRRARFVPLPVTIAHGLAVGTLPDLHADPFDRLLVAQARVEGLTLVTRDARLHAYDVSVLAG